MRLDRVWVAQLSGELRVVCGSSCVVCLGLARLSAAQLCFDWPLASANPRAMVCVLAKHQLCDVHFFAFWLSTIPCATDVIVYTRGGRTRLSGFQLEPEHAVAFCCCALGIAMWRLFLGQCGFDETMHRKRLDGKHGFPFLVCERLSCAELGLVVR